MQLIFIIRLSKIYNIVTIKLQVDIMTEKSKKRFVLLIEPEIFEKFKSLAKEQNRTAGNLGTKLINDYVKENSK